MPRERKRCPAALAALLLELFDRRIGAHPDPPGSSVDWGARLTHDGGAGPSGSGAGPSGMDGVLSRHGDHYLDTLRGDAATRPIWAFSRSLVGVVDEPCSMARTLVALAATCRRARDLCTPGLRKYLVYGMARALARGGAFLKGKRAGTLVASLTTHTVHSPPERLGLVPLLICDETVEVLLPLLRCTDWIDFDDYGILEVFTNYPSFLYKDKHDGRLQVRDVAALLLCARSLRLTDKFMSKFDDDNCWDFSAGYEDDDDTSASRTSKTSRSNMSGHCSTS